MNKKEAIEYYKMAIHNVNEQAMLKYANILFNGDGININK